MMLRFPRSLRPHGATLRPFAQPLALRPPFQPTALYSAPVFVPPRSLCTSAAPEQKEDVPPANVSDGTYPVFLAKDKITLSKEQADSFNRWSIMPRAFMIQIPTGAVYAWSMWQLPLTKTLGVFCPAAADWALASVSSTFACLALGFGFTVGVLGPWLGRAGPRYASLVGTTLFAGGYMVAAAGVATHTLPLVWLGWGLFGGLGWGLCYMSPVLALLAWFPDKKGLASGMGIGAFAGGGLFAAPMIDKLREQFFIAPTFAGVQGAVESKVEAGRQFVMHNGEWAEAIYARTADIASVPGAGNLAEGFYLVGTGDTGVIGALTALGALYGASMGAGAWLMRAPPAGWLPPGMAAAAAPSASAAPAAPAVAQGSVSAKQALRTPQFYLMWLTLGGMATAGVGVISSAKMMMGDIFSVLNPTIVTAGFTTGFVSTLSVANAGGRVGWAAVSDYLGRKNTMYVCSLALPACVAVPQITSMAVEGTLTGSTPLFLFYGTTFAIVTWYGGVLALIPSYCSDVFGPKETPVIYGRLMTSWSVTAVMTPSILSYLKGSATRNAIDSLVAKVTPEAFERAFGAPVGELDALVNAKTVTIARLMEIAPPGTVDPSPFLYDSTFYTMSGVIAVAAVANSMITKMDPKHFMPAEKPPAIAGKEK